MLVTRGYKYTLRVNNKERTLLQQCAGTSRFSWNWGLAQRLEQYKTNTGNERFTDAMKQHKEINRLKKTAFDWMYNYSKCIPQEALRDLDQAFKNFITCRTKGLKVGFPQFKKKYQCKDSFRLTGVIRFYPELKLVQLPRLGKLRLEEKPDIPTNGRILSVTISRTADKWYVSATVEETRFDPPLSQGEILGLDAGLSQFCVLSNRLPIPTSKFLLRRLRKLRRLSKSHSRKKFGSKNRQKSALKLARFYKRVADCRQDFLHKTSLSLAKNHSVLIVEDLHVKGLSMNKKQSKYWHDLAHGEFQRLIRYKTSWYGSFLVSVPRFFPSSKLCSNCLWYHVDLKLKDRTYVCYLCGLKIDRDLNAARNLVNYYHWHAPIIRQLHDPSHSSVAASSSETLNACGELVRPGPPGHDSMNQE
ncbi:MAG: RNA-guided endonuclease InsQ/TnpB family protein [Candidatus Hodarchaeales archaeon]|jgi:putative transposase